MDKNFVNIDDLVRQRLGGGEEQEQSGSWSRMRDILDKEMPQEKRLGIFYWRRMLGAVAVLVLIASISVGGYEFSASRNGNNTGNNEAAPVSANAVNAPVKNSEVNNDRLSAAGIADNSDGKNEQHNNKKLLAANTEVKTKQNHKQPAHKITSSTAKNDQPAIAASSNTTIIKNAPVTTDNNITTKNDQPVAANNTTDNKEANNIVAEKAPVQNTDKHQHTSKTGAPKAIAAVDHKAGEGDNTLPAHRAVAAKTKVVTDQAHSIAKTKDIAARTQPAKAVNHKVAANKVVSDKVAVAGKSATRKKNSGIAAPKAKTVNMNELALSSHTSLPVSPKVAPVAKLPVPGASVAANAVNSSTPALKNQATAAKTNNVAAVNTGKVTSAKSGTVSKLASSKPATTTAAPAGKAGSSIAVNQPLAVATPAPAAIAKAPVVDNKAMKEAYALNAKKGKKVIQKLILFEHYTKTVPDDGLYHLDTISMETLTQELAGENNPLLPSTAAKKSAAREAPNNNSSPVANNNVAGNTTAATGTSANAQILPAASASANGKIASGTKSNAGSKQSAGAAALENMSSTFNDIKYHVNAVQFAPGLTGGINSTFFGPASFKGFQFGVTGDFVFGNDWAFSSELKYFQRINNNYAMADNYYTYTPVPAGGGYNKQQNDNSYSFSTLHSIEMPLIIRYSMGKFNFFVGGNLVYSFSINEGHVDLPDPTVITQTQVVGNDEKPKLDASDFNSRFGVGCIFGISYKVAPNMTLDIRNVQTLWDNANSAGAKYVSDQLYKSPSVQLSLGYRLGGKKTKE